MQKTTAKHFEIFKKECEKWIADFGLTEWNVTFKHEQLKDNVFANCNACYESKLATLSLTIQLDADILISARLRRDALHEVLHLLLWDLTCLGASRFIGKDELLNKEHEAINKLVNYILR